MLISLFEDAGFKVINDYPEPSSLRNRKSNRATKNKC